MPEVTETEVRIPNPRHPDSDFDESWGYRSIPLSPAEGITALIGRLKAALPQTRTAVKTYVFAREKGWTLEKANKWVDDHVKASLDEDIKYEDAVVLAEVDVFDNSNGKLEEKDGLVWKQLLRVGSWPGEQGRGPIDITREMLKDIKSAFDGDAIPNVAVPVTHTDDPMFNSGFVKAIELRNGDTELWIGINFTEPTIFEKVRNGTVKDVSAFVKRLWQDVKTGKLWPWALWHVALTNLPLVPNLKPFLASMGVTVQPCYRYSLSGEEVKPMEKTKREEELEAQLAAANGRVTQVEGELTEAKKGSETFKASIQAEQEKTKGLETELTKSKEIAASLQAEVNAERKKVHDADVQSLILALQGKGKHDKVKMPDGYGFAPIVLQAIEPFLKSDEGNDIVLGIDGKKQSVTSTILSMLNAMAQAKDGVILSYSPHGEQDHRRPGNTPTEAEKDAQVDNYLKDRHLVSEVKK